MADCCTNVSCEIEKLRARQGSTLRAVLGINLAMFVVEAAAGLIAGSTALLADSLDMLGDALGHESGVTPTHFTFSIGRVLLRAGGLAILL